MKFILLSYLNTTFSFIPPHHCLLPVRSQCTGSIADVPLVATLGQCFAGTAKAGFSPAGETTVHT